MATGCCSVCSNAAPPPTRVHGRPKEVVNVIAPRLFCCMHTVRCCIANGWRLCNRENRTYVILACLGEAQCLRQASVSMRTREQHCEMQCSRRPTEDLTKEAPPPPPKKNKMLVFRGWYSSSGLGRKEDAADTYIRNGSSPLSLHPPRNCIYSDFDPPFFPTCLSVIRPRH